MSGANGNNRNGGSAEGRGSPSDLDEAPSVVLETRELVRTTTVAITEPARPAVPTSLSVGIATPQQLEAFRELRTRLIAMAKGLGRSNFITLVVAASPGSGASFVARNLAVAFTLQEQQMAVLVDCNLHHPMQHRALGARSDEAGLFDFLERPEMGIEQLIRPTPIRGLHLIPAGRPPTLPREYFSSQPMRMIIAGLRESPCCSFIDGPPVKGSPDARILSADVDFVILVAGYGHDTVDGITQAASLFDPAKFAGVVFNERH
jgi:Mrp family chromosome partitioning ATPase